MMKKTIQTMSCLSLALGMFVQPVMADATAPAAPVVEAKKELKKIHPFIQAWQKQNRPVLLIKKINLAFGTDSRHKCPDKANPIPNFTREGFADDTTKLIVGKVVLSMDKSVKIGTVFLLELINTEHVRDGKAESSYWLLNCDYYSDTELKIKDDGSVIYYFPDVAESCNGNLLLPRPDLLHGVWKQMYDMVIKEY